MTDNDKEIEAGIKRACECDCAPPSTGWTVNPFPIIRDYMERLKHRAEVIEQAFRELCIDKIFGDECDGFEVDWTLDFYRARAERKLQKGIEHQDRSLTTPISEDGTATPNTRGEKREDDNDDTNR